MILKFILKLFSSNPKKTEPKEKITDLMNKQCICDNPCNEFCADSKIVKTTNEIKSIRVNNPLILSKK